MGDSLMESRGQKRSEMVEALPADKRACNSLEFRPSSSTVTPETAVNSTGAAFQMRVGDMETSSSSAASASGHSEGNGERESPYGSCDSEDRMDDDDDDEEDEDEDEDDRYSSLRELQRSRSQSDSAKFNSILSCLCNDAEPSGQLAALTELCELLSFCTEDTISSLLADQFAASLVKLAKHENNMEIMLLAIRALTYLCDVFPRSSTLLVRHDAVPALCQRLIVIEYLDVAEQCLQALEKISRDQPVACLQSGAIIAVLGYIDFFSTTVQRTALRTVVNICKELPSECPPPVMEAVPRLCMLLQYEDQQLVELVANCLIKVGDRLKDSPEKLSELYGHGLINQVTHLLDLNSRITLSQPTYTGLIGLVAKIASGSADAVETLFELNIGKILKDALLNSDISHGTPSLRTKDNNCTQVHEILKLLHGLLPEVSRDKMEEPLSSSERILLDQPERLQEFGMDILPTLMQVVSSGANLYVCYGCLSVINRLIFFSKPEMLLKLFENINIASFLAGIFTRSDLHVLQLALQIAETILGKLSDILMQSFIKEGVLFAIDNLLMPDSSLQRPFSSTSSSQNKKITAKEVMGCLCYAYCTRISQSNSDSETCKVNKDSVHSLAENLKIKYFSVEPCSSQSMVTDLLEDLRNASLTMNDLLSISPDTDVGAQSEERLCSILDKVIHQLSGNVPVSTFELIESGIIKSLLNYLSNGWFLRSSNILDDDLTHAYGIQKRFETFARISLSSPDPVSQDLPLSMILRKLHSALSTVETMPVMPGYATKQRISYATVPNGRPTMYQCLKVRFVRGEEEVCLGDYSKDVVGVEPFCLVEEIELFLRPKVVQINKESSEASTMASLEAKTESGQVTIDVGSLSDNCQGSGSTSTVTPYMQDDGDEKSHSSAMDISDSGRSTVIGAEASIETQSRSPEEKIPSSDAPESHIGTSSMSTTGLHGDDENNKNQSQASFKGEEISSKLALYLDGEQLEYSSTLYQEILQRRKNGSKLWSSTYTITYRRVTVNGTSSYKEPGNLYNSAATDKLLLCRQVMPLFSNIFAHGLGSKLDSSSTSSDIILLLRCLEIMNRFSYHLVSYERINSFTEGKLADLNDFKVALPTLSQYEFVSSRLTDKLEQQMRDSSAVHVGAMPLWCGQLIARCPFLFSFKARCKFFQLAAFGKVQIPPNTSSHNDSNSSRDRRASGSPLRKKFMVCRERILESATLMMDLSVQKKVVIEVEYNEEVGTGLGPTLEFYTLVCHEFQKAGLGMWRGDYMLPTDSCSEQGSSSSFITSISGLFPRPWSPTTSSINGIEFSDIIKKYVLLGQFVGKALQDGRVLDIPFSTAFYKLVLGKELSLCDVQSFDPELGRSLLEFKALVSRQNYEFACGINVANGDSLRFQHTKIEDLCLDFTLPGYSDYVHSGMNDVMVNISNLEEYISFVLDATLQTGVSRQVDAFKSGLNQVISYKHLQIFTEEELERLLCGERDSWLSSDLFDHIKFDHGYTAGSPPIINLLEIISEFTYEQRRAFLQFVTGAPRLPPGGLAALNPKLTIVRKQSSNCPDSDLPSVMTCANYLKLPPYSSKEKMKDKLLYAITEGQGSFHLS